MAEGSPSVFPIAGQAGVFRGLRGGVPSVASLKRGLLVAERWVAIPPGCGAGRISRPASAFSVFKESKKKPVEGIAEIGSTHGSPHPGIVARIPGAIPLIRFLSNRASEGREIRPAPQLTRSTLLRATCRLRRFQPADCGVSDRPIANCGLAQGEFALDAAELPLPG